MRTWRTAFVLGFLVGIGTARAADPEFAQPEPAAVGSGKSAVALATSDIDGDGVRDLLFADSSGGPAYFRGVAPGRFADQATDVFNPTGLTATNRYLTGDFDGDGDLDLGFLGLRTVFRNLGSGGFEFVEGFTQFDSEGILVRVAGRSQPDLVTWPQDGALRRIRFDGGMQFTEQPDIPLPADMGSLASLDVRDMNGDGREDLVVCSYRSEIAVAFQSADGAFAFEPAVSVGPLGTLGSTLGCIPGDFDGDGDLELLHLGRVFVHDGSGGFEESPHRSFPASFATASSVVRAADMDNDGIDDLLYLEADRRLRIVRAGAAGFTTANLEIQPDPYDIGIADDATPLSLRVEDLDGDGRRDVIVSLANPAGIVVVRQSGAPAPLATTIQPTVISEAGEQSIRFGGSGFVSGLTVDLGDVVATAEVSNVTASEVVVVADFLPGEGGGSRPFEIRNPDGQVARGAVELHSVRIDPVRAVLRDGIEPARDRLVLHGSLIRTTLSPEAAATSVDALRRDGATLRIGGDLSGPDTGGAFVLRLEPADPRWRVRARGRVLEFRTGPEEFPRVALRIVRSDGRLRLRVSHYDHADEDPSSAVVRVATGADSGATPTTWVRRRGRWRL